MKRRTTVLLALCFSATSLMAQPAQQQSVDAGVTVAVDAKGNLRQPTAAEQADLASRQPRSIMKLQPMVHATGMVSITLDDSFDHAFIVRTDEEGNLAFACTNDHQEASSFVSRAASLDSIMRIRPVAGPRVAAAAERE